MTDYRHNWRDGYHPLFASPGGSAIRPWGMDVPALGPVHGGAEWAPCQTQVIEWPWAADDAGVPFDQSNLWGVRTRCWGIDEVNNPGDRDWWVAVPKTLPVGYTPRGRSHVQPMIYDHLGDDPMRGVVEIDGFGYSTRPIRWRTPTGQYPSDLGDEGYLWVPMNLNQEVHAKNFNTGWGTESPATPLPGFPATNFRNRQIADVGMHIGFRGGKVRFEWRKSTPTISGASEYKLRSGYSDSAPSFGDHPTSIIDTKTISIAADATALGWNGTHYVWLWEYDLPALLAPIGARKYFFTTLSSVAAGDQPGFWDFSIKYSPRTDVPLWYWASQRNRVAPGGIIQP